MDNLTALAVVFLCVFCLYLYYNNKKLNQIIDDLRSRDKEQYEKKVLKEDVVDIEDISHDIKDIDKTIDKDNKKVVVNKDSKIVNRGIEDKVIVKKSIVNNEDNNSNKMVKKFNNDKNNVVRSDNNIKFDVEEFIKKDKYINRKLDSSDMNSEYLQEISRELENNMVPQTIKLTDYEQEQEDNAIISYKELLNVNNKKEETINDETVEFIEELKKFRNNLDR